MTRVLFRVPSAGEADAGAPAFGGVGLMVDQPGVVVTVRPAESWRFEGEGDARSADREVEATGPLDAPVEGACAAS